VTTAVTAAAEAIAMQQHDAELTYGKVAASQWQWVVLLLLAVLVWPETLRWQGRKDC
jgi:hypothetical protein